MIRGAATNMIAQKNIAGTGFHFKIIVRQHPLSGASGRKRYNTIDFAQ